jgi:hypothetical protein
MRRLFFILCLIFLAGVCNALLDKALFRKRSELRKSLGFTKKEEKMKRPGGKRGRSKRGPRAEIIDLDPEETVLELDHPQHSPRRPTAIDSMNQHKYLACDNQAKCIIPELQLLRKYKIYLCQRSVYYGVRFEYLIREGLLMHPAVFFLPVEDLADADLIFYLPGSTPWTESECNNIAYASKLIVIDEFDSSALFVPVLNKEEYIATYGSLRKSWYNLYFKRSYVNRTEGALVGYPNLRYYEVFPFTYPLAEGFIPAKFNHKRPVEILCTLRGNNRTMTTRYQVRNWIKDYAQERDIVKQVVVRQVDSSNRTHISPKYVHQMSKSWIIVTANPTDWEGDFRLWEALGSGALVFVDPLFVPHAYPLVDKEHVVYFSSRNKTDLFEKLDYYRGHPEIARRIALNGYFHAMRYHRSVNLIDYILRTTHMKEMLNLYRANTQAGQPAGGITLPEYHYTGQYLVYLTRLQEKKIVRCQQPGIYFAEPFMKNNTIFAVHNFSENCIV